MLINDLHIPVQTLHLDMYIFMHSISPIDKFDSMADHAVSAKTFWVAFASSQRKLELPALP